MTPEPKLRVLIVDDGVLARQRLESLVGKTTDYVVVASIDNGDAAVRAIRELEPDLVFLDIQMPGKTGIEVVTEIGPEKMPTTIFVTAYDDYAIRAFELDAVDYLLKPFDDERFEQALHRARRFYELKKTSGLAQPLRELLARFGMALPNTARDTAYLQRLPVEIPGQIRVLYTADIDYISASGHYVELHCGEKSYPIRERMDYLEDHLDPQKFFRIHRSSIVQLDRIASLIREAGGDYAVKLKSGVQLAVGRGRIDALEKWIGVAGKR